MGVRANILENHKISKLQAFLQKPEFFQRAMLKHREISFPLKPWKAKNDTTNPEIKKKKLVTNFY